MQKFLDSLRDKRVAVVGVGISNMPLLRLLIDAGIDVSARDKSAVECGGLARSVFGDGYLDCRGEDIVFRSPGVRPWELALDPGTTLTSEMETFFELCPCPIIAVTGSDGKTTTTTLIAELLRAEGRTVHLGGNLGRPLLTEAPNIAPGDFAVVELSSFQLMTMRRSPHIAVITNVTPNHLDWHRSYDEYVAAKCNIFLWQQPGDRLIYGNAAQLGAIRPQKMLGEHNQLNFATAVEATRGLVSDAAIRKVAETFVGVEHRLEFVRELRGVRYYNCSIASSPNRTIADLRSFRERVILVAGGKDKGVPFDALGPVICERVKALVLSGPTSEPIAAAVRECGMNTPPIEQFDAFDDAVRRASSLAEPGDVVLLSPASTSFDRFKNFEERGQRFKSLVYDLS